MVKFITSIVVIILVTAVVVFQAKKGETNTNAPAGYRECATDADCSVAGCSGQICTTASRASGLVTTCEARPEYQCLQQASCLCLNGFCRFDQTEAYLSCLDNLPKTNQ